MLIQIISLITVYANMFAGNHELPQKYLNELKSPTFLHRDTYLSPRQRIPHDMTSRDMTQHEMTSLEMLSRGHHELDGQQFYTGSSSLRNKLSSLFGEQDVFRAKRRIDMDDDYASTPKRLKTGKRGD